MLEPTTIEPSAFRAALSRFVSGVTVVFAQDGERFAGATVSAFTSVSLAPPLILVCLRKSSSTLALALETDAFTVALLSNEQQALARRFASPPPLKLTEPAPIDALLAQSAANLKCRPHSWHEAGDHTILVGLVIETNVRESGPLAYHRGRYGTFVETNAVGSEDGS